MRLDVPARYVDTLPSNLKVVKVVLVLCRWEGARVSGGERLQASQSCRLEALTSCIITGVYCGQLGCVCLVVVLHLHGLLLCVVQFESPRGKGKIFVIYSYFVELWDNVRTQGHFNGSKEGVKLCRFEEHAFIALFEIIFSNIWAWWDEFMSRDILPLSSYVDWYHALFTFHLPHLSLFNVFRFNLYCSAIDDHIKVHLGPCRHYISAHNWVGFTSIRHVIHFFIAQINAACRGVGTRHLNKLLH